MRWIFPERSIAFVLCLALLALSQLAVSCSGSAAKTPAPGSSPTPPGSGGPGPGPSPSPNPSPSSGAATFLYVGIGSNQGGVQGFHVDQHSGALAEVPGSPVLFGTSMNAFPEAGPVAVAHAHVFVGFGPPNFALPVIRSYSVDPSTGSLGNFTETGAGATAGGDAQFRALVTDPAGRNLYVVYQNSIASFMITGDGTLSSVGTLSNLATAFTFSLAINPAANFAYLGVDNCPPKGTCSGPPDILLLNRDPNTGALSNTGKSMGQNNVMSPGALAVDPSGTHLVASTVTSTGAPQISVFNIDASGSLSPAPGSPYATPGGLSPAVFRFDSTGKFLYVLNSALFAPNPEAVTAYAFNPEAGTLQQVQSQSLPSGNFASTLLVSNSFVIVVDSQAGTMPSVIYVLQRDANTGMVSSPVFTQVDKPGGQQAGLGDAALLSF